MNPFRWRQFQKNQKKIERVPFSHVTRLIAREMSKPWKRFFFSNFSHWTRFGGWMKFEFKKKNKLLIFYFGIFLEFFTVRQRRRSASASWPTRRPQFFGFMALNEELGRLSKSVRSNQCQRPARRFFVNSFISFFLNFFKSYFRIFS